MYSLKMPVLGQVLWVSFDLIDVLNRQYLPFYIFTGNGGMYNNGVSHTGALSMNDYTNFGHVQPLVSGAHGLMSQPFPTLPTYADYQNLTGMGRFCT